MEKFSERIMIIFFSRRTLMAFCHVAFGIIFISDAVLGFSNSRSRQLITQFLEDEIPEKEIKEKVIATKHAANTMYCNHICLSNRGCITSLFGVSDNKCILLKSYINDVKKYHQTHDESNHIKTIVLRAQDACEPNPCNKAARCVKVRSGFKCKCLAHKTGVFCDDDRCSNIAALGMEDDTIPDGRITASSEIAAHYGPKNARLNNGYGWVSQHSTDATSEYLQVDFQEKKLVYAIATQGSPVSNAWVETYEVSYCNNGTMFQTVIEKSTSKPIVFSGNSDQSTVVKNKLDPPLYTRYIRINPKQKHGLYYALRLEFYGCNVK